jgi:hopanoid biosynthesis associated protein HpnK
VTPEAFFTADDFGLSVAVNEAVEQAHLHGVLHAASLMVAGPAAADAVARARRLPGLRVGLHLVAIEGPAVLPPAAIPDLVDGAGRFSADQVRRGFAYAACGKIRRQLAQEVAAQFAAYAATGLPLHHADAHKHMHLHPVVARLMIDAGRAHGLRRLRVPAEPPDVLAACGERVGPGAHALYYWTRQLRRTAHRAGLATPKHCFGLHWSGSMTADRLLALARHLPPGGSEIYLHPASRTDATLARLMPHYRHTEEFSALLDPRVRAAFAAPQ